MKKLGCAKCGGMKKMQEGGIPPPPSRMQYIEAEKLKNKKPYYTKDNIYIGDPKKKKEIDAMIERKTKANTKGMDFSGKKKYATGGPINKPMTYAKAQRGDTNQGMGIFGAPQIGQGAMDGKTGQMKKGGLVKSKATKFAKGGSTFGMLSVKAGIDKNPKPTAADRIAGVKKIVKKIVKKK